MKDIFFQCFFPRYFVTRIFSPRNQSARYFFFQKSPIPPFKSETVSPLVDEGYGCPQSYWCLYLPIEEKTMSLWVFYYLHLTSSLLQFQSIFVLFVTTGSHSILAYTFKATLLSNCQNLPLLSLWLDSRNSLDKKMDYILLVKSNWWSIINAAF